MTCMCRGPDLQHTDAADGKCRREQPPVIIIDTCALFHGLTIQFSSFYRARILFRNFSASRFWFRALRPPGPLCVWSDARLTIRQRWTIRGGRQNFGPRVLRGVPLIFLSALLVVIRLDDIAHDGSCRRSPMLAAALDDRRNHNLRIASGSVADEPPIGFFPFLSQADSCVVAH